TYWNTSHLTSKAPAREQERVTMFSSLDSI
ncbi:hypothetical protein GCK32_017855, partial [Trichostrongylus colubriformis]